MKNPKIIISVKGGNVVGIGANQNIDIIVIDYDNISQGDKPISGILEPDFIYTEEFYKSMSFDQNDAEEKEVYEALKELKF